MISLLGKPLRLILPAMLLGGWLWQGQRIMGVLNPSPERDLEQQIGDIRKLNPEADAFFARLDRDRDASALGASIRAAEDQYGEDSALRAFADQFDRRGDPASFRLLRLASDIDLASSETDREAILHAHGMTVQNLMADESGFAADDYLTQLEQAADDRTLWPVVRDDPIGLLLHPYLSAGDGEAWQFYRDERDWLAEVLATAAPAPVEEGGALVESAGGGSFLAGLVRVAQTYHPLVKTAVVEHEFGLAAFPLFEAYGEFVKEAHRLGVPVDETLEIIFANQDQFELPVGATARARAVREHADRLIHLKKNKPDVWDAAKAEPLVLRLDGAVPSLSQNLITKFRGNDIAAFLFTAYEDEIAPAAAALDKFGDLGLYILNRYQDDPRTRELLMNPAAGPRTVPFLARFGDEGFEKLDDNLKWLDRYFDAQGNAIDGDHWYQAVPILGAPISVVHHWAKGEPVSAGELGWVALDVFDGALLIASFGASAPVTATRQGAKVGARQAVKAGVRQSARNSAMKLGARSSTRAVVRDSLLRRFVGRVALVAAPLTSGGKAVFRFGSTTVSRLGAGIRRSAAGLHTSWASSPARFRTWAYRGLLAVGLYFTVTERTMPNMPDVAEAVGAGVGSAIADASKALGTVLASALRESLNVSSSAAARVVYIVVALILILFVARPLFSGPRRIRRVA